MKDYRDFLRNSLNEQTNRRRQQGLSSKRYAIAMTPGIKTKSPYARFPQPKQAEPNMPGITPDDYMSPFDNYRGATATHKAMDDYGAMDADGGVEGIIERY